MPALDNFRLDGKTALVTGARRGIGKAIAIALAEVGADIIGVSASMESKGSELEAAVTRAGHRFRGYACDFSDRASVHEFSRQVLAENSEIDILINNAGTIRRAPAAEHTDSDWDVVLEVNLTSQFILSREIGKGMLERASGKIIFTASLLSFQGGINVPGYSASKGAIAQLTMALANEWAGKGVNVNAIAPGYVRTDNTQALQDDADRSAAILARIPAGRWAGPEDMAGAAVFLASPASDYVHGTVLAVDGGWLGR